LGEVDFEIKIFLIFFCREIYMTVFTRKMLKNVGKRMNGSSEGTRTHYDRKLHTKIKTPMQGAFLLLLPLRFFSLIVI